MIRQGSATTPEEVMCCLEVMEEALSCDDSMGTMPDVKPADAVRWILSNLIAKGYTIIGPER